ncbi:MAG: type II toxin-antitoxin system RelE/ParE family toxin [Caldilineaceae bacterium]
MAWEVEYTNQFEDWWYTLDEQEQDSIDMVVGLLEERGPSLPYPYSSAIATSRHPHMRELRVQHKGLPYRILYAFDPRRTAILLIGGNKAGNDRWYDQYIPVADRLYDEHLDELDEEG